MRMLCRYIARQLSYGKKHFCFILCMAVPISCTKLIEVDPPINEIIGNEIYNSDITAASVLTGIYTNISNSIFTGRGSISLKVGLAADELVNTTDAGDILNYLYTNSLTNNGDQLFWSELYSFIFRVNSAIEGVTSSAGLTETVRKQLLGEAKFLRAFMYFYLVNLYGDVPLLQTTDIKINSVAPRTNLNDVYKAIVKDLIDAQLALSDEYLNADCSTMSSERLRPNRSVATALLSRVYLYQQKWLLAETEATKIISSADRYYLEPLISTFLRTSHEAIWQIQPVDIMENTKEAQVFVLAAGVANSVPGPNGTSRPVYLSHSIINDFEVNDNRKNVWTDSVIVDNIVYPFTYKYKAWELGESRTEYLVVFRLAEQYLIRAEARAMQGRLTGVNSALSDINIIRDRAGLQPVATIANAEKALNIILKERKVEFFTEWGHRWFDLKRTRQINTVMEKATLDKGGSWMAYKELFPIPVQDIQRNPSFKGHQNPGYPER